MRFGPVVTAIVIDPALHERLHVSPRKAAFYCGAVAALARDLDAQGGRLIVRRGALAATARRLARDARARAVVWASSYDAAGVERDRRLQSALEESGLQVMIVHDMPAVPPEETADARTSDSGTGYRSFASYLAMWRKVPRRTVAAGAFQPGAFALADAESEALPAPADFGSSTPAVETGERIAAAALDRFLEAPVLRYAAGRFAPDSDATSHLSAHLSFGTIAARTVAARTEERSADRFLLEEERLSIALYLRSIAQRDFFLQLAWFFENRTDEALQARMRTFGFARTHPDLGAWEEGRTGFSLVDAGMRQLRTTGWMHPHARMVAASFLCFDLGVDWRVGRDVWERELTEDDPALATGNWQWIAGVGADLAQYPRIYNPDVQARRFDPLRSYARRWIAELPEAGPARAGSRQIMLPLFGTNGYPARIVDHPTAARAFLTRYRAFAGTIPRPS